MYLLAVKVIDIVECYLIHVVDTFAYFFMHVGSYLGKKNEAPLVSSCNTSILVT